MSSSSENEAFYRSGSHREYYEDEPSLEGLTRQFQRLRRKTRTEVEHIVLLERELQELKNSVGDLKKSVGLAVELRNENGNSHRKLKEKHLSTRTDYAESEPQVSKPYKEAQNEDDFTIEGFLEKKAVLNAAWNRRWFCLTKDRNLCYFEKEGTNQEPKGVIPLINATCYARVDKKGVFQPTMFNIRTETRDLLLRAPDVETKQKWVAALRKACVRGELTPDQKKLLYGRKESFLGTTEDELKTKNKSQNS